jgi:hypothetical protein
MTPKDKAKELIRRFYSVGAIECKECALIAVDEIIEALREHEWQNRNVIDYYLEVKQEIELL